MNQSDMKRLYLEHREVEEARDLDAVVATFDDDCFLENVALGTRAEGRDAVRKSYEALFATFPDLSPTSDGEAYGRDVFVTWGTVKATMNGAWLGIEPTHRTFTCVRERRPIQERKDARRTNLLRSPWDVRGCRGLRRRDSSALPCHQVSRRTRY